MRSPIRFSPRYRKLVAQKFDGSKHRSFPGRPRTSTEVECLIVQFARENSGWGYTRIAGALANVDHNVAAQTVGNILRRHGIAPATKRRQTTTWRGMGPAWSLIPRETMGSVRSPPPQLGWLGVSATRLSAYRYQDGSCRSCNALPNPSLRPTPLAHPRQLSYLLLQRLH